MALPTTGSLSGDQIDDEFPDSIDGGRPMSLSEYRGVLASKNGALYTLPTGQIAYSDFRGVSAGYEIDVLIVAGGGGGGGGTNIGADYSGGGGGAGGLRIINDIFAIPETNYSITVGSGGAGKPAGNGNIASNYGERGNNGNNSSFGTNTATGGGGGGGGRDSGQQTGGSGGSGGGAGGVTADNNGGGNGTGVQGKRGGGGDKTANSEGGGGGGYNGVGSDARVNGSNGDGGSGYNLESFMGTAAYRTRVAGGGGGGRTTSPEGGGNGNDGGGNGAFRSLGLVNRGNAQNGANLSGGGGGGGCESNGGRGGGNGVVIVRYRGTSERGSGGVVTTGVVGGVNYVFHRFGSNSTFTS